ncbi:MAG: hypothetical protein CFH34_00998 [Alphaproteobacteria bacterium MarineAlpha9_Bin4]|nr:hypothetical protein [Pelagibacterales bacterium]PPR26362.1 MAG: hypothetical protein CFH34_00998 [Alphaproteobacteria bacterium MarineAlpha9_Bin4]|tara:strand:- start:247 stop:444 length:198 start_codon:yes stop_codon:yes gene_type:complete
MFFGWLKGILANILIGIGLISVVMGLIATSNEMSGTFYYVLGAVFGAIGSYLKYVSKQTVKSVKK